MIRRVFEQDTLFHIMTVISAGENELIRYWKGQPRQILLQKDVKATLVCVVLSHLDTNFPSRIFCGSDQLETSSS